MSRESLIFLLVVLAVWGLSVVARWLQKEIERNAANKIEFEPIEESPSLETESVPKPETLETIETIKPILSATLNQDKQTHQRKLSNQLGLDSTQTLRQGIILMTILGPCRANEPISTIRSF